MASWRQLKASLERVLGLAERALEDRVGGGPDADGFARDLAFRWDVSSGPGRLRPVEAPDLFDLADLVGVDRSVARLVRNTEQFLEGLPRNHVLLYGERGTGKSSAVKGLLHRYGKRGLRIVEVRRDELEALPRILSLLRKAPQRFLVFCDDLSFGAGESGYRELKAVLQGGLEATPDNVCLVATSNRRHLLPEHRSENRAARLDEDGELHLGEALEEKLALSDRFGLVLGFFSFDQETYLRIVEHYVEQSGVVADAGQIRQEALRWALDRSSRSGRTARQFVDDLVGRLGLAGSEA